MLVLVSMQRTMLVLVGTCLLIFQEINRSFRFPERERDIGYEIDPRRSVLGLEDGIISLDKTGQDAS